MNGFTSDDEATPCETPRDKVLARTSYHPRAMKQVKAEVTPLETSVPRRSGPAPYVWTDRQRHTSIQENDDQWPRVVNSVNVIHGSSFDEGSVKKQWKNLRDCFMRNHRALTTVPTGSGRAAVPQKWKLGAKTATGTGALCARTLSHIALRSLRIDNVSGIALVYRRVISCSFGTAIKVIPRSTSSTKLPVRPYTQSARWREQTLRRVGVIPHFRRHNYAAQTLALAGALPFAAVFFGYLFVGSCGVGTISFIIHEIIPVSYSLFVFCGG
ncbi:hypothetical protein Q1695_006015 [Nippostrongylus brasiliensis]|nr:hypothetical protein Q1695_006015 [Nippostrongylus brasiliensis]